VNASVDRFRLFVDAMTALVAASKSEETLIAEGGALLRTLVAHDDWLPAKFAEPLPKSYAQYLLYLDPSERFSVVSFVWGPGQSTPVHDHTVWGLVGVLRGAERCEEFESRGGAANELGEAHVMTPGQVQAVSPTLGDWHRVANASEGVSISIHVYGADIGSVRRHRLDDSGRMIDFISRYDNSGKPGVIA
jgi:3-mercaptopropionate dioxygenase